MYKRIKEFFNQERKGRVLCISGKGFISEQFHPDSEIIVTSYPENGSKFNKEKHVDIHNMPYSDESFDYVIANQVFEHIENPWKAIDEVYRVLKVGGHVIITTPFLMQIHSLPTDYWRFTPDALKLLCRKFRKIIQCEKWGNREAIDLVFNKELQYEEIIPNTQLEKIATKNEKNFPIHVWIIAKK